MDGLAVGQPLAAVHHDLVPQRLVDEVDLLAEHVGRDRGDGELTEELRREGFELALNVALRQRGVLSLFCHFGQALSMNRLLMRNLSRWLVCGRSAK